MKGRPVKEEEHGQQVLVRHTDTLTDISRDTDRDTDRDIDRDADTPPPFQTHTIVDGQHLLARKNKQGKGCERQQSWHPPIVVLLLSLF